VRAVGDEAGREDLPGAPVGVGHGREHAGQHRSGDVQVVAVDGGDDGLLARRVVDADQPQVVAAGERADQQPGAVGGDQLRVHPTGCSDRRRAAQQPPLPVSGSNRGDSTCGRRTPVAV
jgi:hypothetical protein